MTPIRLPVAANNAGDTDTGSIGASTKFFSNMFHGGGSRKSSITGEPLGCLSLLDAGEQVERPRAIPSPGLAGEILPTCVKVQAQPTIHIHRPRAVLSSPDNDELSCEVQGQQGKKSILIRNAPKAVPSPSQDHPHVPLSTIEDPGSLLPSKEIPKAVASPLDELSSVRERETSISNKASSLSTASNHEEHIIEPLPSHGLSNELVHMKQFKMLALEATKEKKFNCHLPSKSRLEQNGNEENLSSLTTANQTVKKHSSLPSSASRGPAKQLSKPTAKGDPGRVLRPWY